MCNPCQTWKPLKLYTENHPYIINNNRFAPWLLELFLTPEGRFRISTPPE